MKQAVDIAELAQSISVHIICKSSDKEKIIPNNEKKPDVVKSGGPHLVATYDNWQVYILNNIQHGSLCYMRVSPNNRYSKYTYFFISSNPKQKSYNEIHFNLSIRAKKGSIAKLYVGKNIYELKTQGPNAMVSNSSLTKEIIQKMKENTKIQIDTESEEGDIISEVFNISRFEQSYSHLQQICP